MTGSLVLKQAREHKRLSMREVAQQANMSYPVYRHYEEESAEYMSWNHAVDIAAVLDLSIYEILKPFD